MRANRKRGKRTKREYQLPLEIFQVLAATAARLKKSPNQLVKECICPGALQKVLKVGELVLRARSSETKSVSFSIVVGKRGMGTALIDRAATKLGVRESRAVEELVAAFLEMRAAQFNIPPQHRVLLGHLNPDAPRILSAVATSEPRPQSAEPWAKLKSNWTASDGASGYHVDLVHVAPGTRTTELARFHVEEKLECVIPMATGNYALNVRAVNGPAASPNVSAVATHPFRYPDAPPAAGYLGA